MLIPFNKSLPIYISYLAFFLRYPVGSGCEARIDKLDLCFRNQNASLPF